MKPKYRFTPFMSGAVGLKTVYRQDIQTGIDWMISDFKKTAILRNFDGRITVYERRYRLTDRCLFWKPLKQVYIKNGQYTVEDHETDTAFEEKFWKRTCTEEELATTEVSK